MQHACIDNQAWHPGDSGLGSHEKTRYWSWAGTPWDHLVCLQQHLVPRLPLCRGRGRGEQQHHNSESYRVGSSLWHVGSVFRKKLVIKLVKNGTVNPNYKIIVFSPKFNTAKVICSHALATISWGEGEIPYKNKM